MNNQSINVVDFKTYTNLKKGTCGFLGFIMEFLDKFRSHFEYMLYLIVRF